MKFYTSIASHYDQIFPYQQSQKAFVESFKNQGFESTLLDVGCGTGSLLLHLADSFGTVIGIDPDKEMLDLARLKALRHKFDRQAQLEELGTWVFLQKGMLDLRAEFAPASFNVVLCLGNTLVHLASVEEVSDFLSQAFEILKPGGNLMLQIINYSRIIDQNLKGLPTIENEWVKFERNYRYEADPEVIHFQTILSLKESGAVIENEVPLLTVGPQQLKQELEAAGFKEFQEFGSFSKEGFNSSSQPYIVVARK